MIVFGLRSRGRRTRRPGLVRIRVRARGRGRGRVGASHLELLGVEEDMALLRRVRDRLRVRVLRLGLGRRSRR